MRALLHFRIISLSVLLNLTCPLAWGQTPISPQLLVQTNEEVTFPGWYFSLGLFQEGLHGSAKHEYEASGTGVSLGAFQRIRQDWAGGLELRWSDWRAVAAGVEDVSPLSIFSKIEYAPSWAGKTAEGLSLHPYLTGGLGYMALFSERSWTAGHSQTSFGETAATFGGGLRIVTSSSWGVKLGVEMWRGLETDHYTSMAYMLQFLLGDMGEF